MKNLILYSGLVVLLWACGQSSELTKYNWIIVDGIYKNQPIQFRTTDFIRLTDRDGNEIQGLNFSEDGTIMLPGINSPTISAKWKIAEDRIYITIDSAKYFLYNSADVDLSFLDPSDTIPNVEARKDNLIQKVFSSTETTELTEAMQIYGQPFHFFISQDTLVLKGQHVTIRAVEDRTIDDLLRDKL